MKELTNATKEPKPLLLGKPRPSTVAKRSSSLFGYTGRLAVFTLLSLALCRAPACLAVQETVDTVVVTVNKRRVVNRLIGEGHYEKALAELPRTEGQDSAAFRKLKDWVTSGYRQNLTRSDTDNYAESTPDTLLKPAADFGADIMEGWDAGKQLSAVAVSTTKGFGIMSKGTGYTTQLWASRRTFARMKEWMAEKDAEGYFISDFATTGTDFFCVMSKGTGYTDQTWARRSNSNDVGEWITKKWDEGYKITVAAMDISSYFVVASKGSGLGQQSWAIRSSLSKMKEWIKEKWDDDYYVTAIDTDGTNYFVVMSKGTGWTGQTYRLCESGDDLTNWIRDKWKDGYQVTGITSDGQRRLLVMSKGTGLTNQIWFFNNR